MRIQFRKYYKSIPQISLHLPKISKTGTTTSLNMMNKPLYALILSLSTLLFGCTDEPDGNGIHPDKYSPDPEETVTISLYKNTSQNLDGIFIDVNDKFSSSNQHWLFCSLGQMNGLGNVTSIPANDNWDTSVRVQKGYGYVAYNALSNQFYRLFVSNSATDEMGTITGFQIKYQKPFFGKDEAVTIDSLEFKVPNGLTAHIVTPTNESIVPFKILTDCDWIKIEHPDNFFGLGLISGYGFPFFVTESQSLDPRTGHITIKTFFGKETTITVTQEAMTPWPATTSILELKRRYWSDENYSATKMPADVIIRGRVVSSDEAGNIFKTIVIEDETAALPISINQYNTYLTFPYGQEVALKFGDGTYIGNYAGFLEIGSLYYINENPSVSFLTPELIADKQLIGEPNPSKVYPIKVTISELSDAIKNPAELMKWQGRYVTLSDISFREQGVPLGESHISNTSRMVYDATGLQIAISTSGYSNFYSTSTPKGVGSVSGILTFYKGAWLLKLNSVQDIGDFDANESITPPVANDEPTADSDQPKGDGSQNTPYNVAAVISLNNPGTQNWVEGYIVGAINGQTMYDATFTGPFEYSYNIIIADSYPETDIAKCIPVQLPPGMVRINLNLLDNPDNLGKKIRVYGSLEKYYNKTGVKGTSTFGI